jgi:predicted TIM-barrel fold metal-dependent hydrolase
MIIDVHCHAWPDHIAERALGPRVPQLPRVGDGKISTLPTVLEQSGVDRGVLLGIADSAKYVDGTNRFVGRSRGGSLFGFGTIHPDLSVEENLASLRANGIQGVKLHSLFQGFAYDDRRVWDVLEAFGSEIAVIAHVGAGGDRESNERATPGMIRDIVRQFPDLRMIACHFGGYHKLEEAEADLLGENVYLETSWPPTLATLAPEKVREIIGKHGADRVVFGSDWPMADPAAEIAAIRALGLSDDATEGILGGNFARLMGITDGDAAPGPTTDPSGEPARG